VTTAADVHERLCVRGDRVQIERAGYEVWLPNTPRGRLSTRRSRVRVLPPLPSFHL